LKDTPLTEKEIHFLEKTTGFTLAQLKEAGKKLGYKRILSPVVVSHIKNKICSTQQQRSMHAGAAKMYTQKILSSHPPR
jgi:hypothetical protein